MPFLFTVVGPICRLCLYFCYKGVLSMRKWKVLSIIVIIVLLLGIAAKFAVDKLFTLLLMYQLKENWIGISIDDYLDDYIDGNIGSQLQLQEALESSDKSGPDMAQPAAHSSGPSSKATESELLTSGSANQTSGSETQNTEPSSQTSKPGTKESEREERKTGDTGEAEKNETTGKPGESVTEGEAEKAGSKDSAEGTGKAVTSGKKGNAEEDEAEENGAGEKEAQEKIAREKSEADVTAGKNEETGTYGKSEKDDGKPVTETVGTEEKSSPREQGASDTGIQVTPEKVKEAEKEVSTEDKLKVLGIIFSKLEPSDISTLMGILRKGRITDEDINLAKEIIKDRVTPEEKEFLKNIFEKYKYLIK